MGKSELRYLRLIFMLICVSDKKYNSCELVLIFSRVANLITDLYLYLTS